MQVRNFQHRINLSPVGGMTVIAKNTKTTKNSGRVFESANFPRDSFFSPKMAINTCKITFHPGEKLEMNEK